MPMSFGLEVSKKKFQIFSNERLAKRDKQIGFETFFYCVRNLPQVSIRTTTEKWQAVEVAENIPGNGPCVFFVEYCKRLTRLASNSFWPDTRRIFLNPDSSTDRDFS